MPRERTYDFEPIRMDTKAEKDEALPIISIYKNGQMLISKTANHAYGLAGKAVEFEWAPSKRTLGMKLVYHKPSTESWDDKTMRLLTEKATGQIGLSIGRIMKRLGLDHIDFKSMELDKYVSLADDRTYFVMQLPKVEKTTE